MHQNSPKRPSQKCSLFDGRRNDESDPSSYHCIIFSLCLVRYFILKRYCKASFIMGLIFYICLSFDIFHLAVFFVFLCHINICIVKKTYNNFSVLTTPVKLIISLWDCVCIGVHSSVNMFFLFFITFSFHWLFMMVLKVVLQGW